ncbi:hypothetical protein PAPYR_10998 [Paratrimastix pyriformis]|uniref:Uncharacterized protein n=1 Tax=Paratrimastix pyriformis TaxID=342808 RepID=A0ABQ8U9S4_9EUKA|nr:hypothetical protein PAPYR_10998 [Paratrimastix pyriformis]
MVGPQPKKSWSLVGLLRKNWSLGGPSFAKPVPTGRDQTGRSFVSDPWNLVPSTQTGQTSVEILGRQAIGDDALAATHTVAPSALVHEDVGPTA